MAAHTRHHIKYNDSRILLWTMLAIIGVTIMAYALDRSGKDRVSGDHLASSTFLAEGAGRV